MKGGRCGGGRKMFLEIEIFFLLKMKKVEDGLWCVLFEGNMFF